MFNPTPKLYTFTDLSFTSTSETVQVIFNELSFKKAKDLSHLTINDFMLYHSYPPLIIKEQRITLEQGSDHSPRHKSKSQSKVFFISGLQTFAAARRSGQKMHCITLRNDVPEESELFLSWADLTMQLPLLYPESYPNAFERIKQRCPIDIQHRLFGGKLTQTRFLNMVNASKHTLQSRLRAKSHRQDTLPKRPTLADLLLARGSKHVLRK